MRTFRAKLSCLNCGLEEFYRLPFKADITGYRNDVEERLSSYESDDKEFDLNCMNCGLSYLVGNNFWEPGNEYGLRQNDRRGETSSPADGSGEVQA